MKKKAKSEAPRWQEARIEVRVFGTMTSIGSYDHKGEDINGVEHMRRLYEGKVIQGDKVVFSAGPNANGSRILRRCEGWIARRIEKEWKSLRMELYEVVKAAKWINDSSPNYVEVHEQMGLVLSRAELILAQPSRPEPRVMYDELLIKAIQEGKPYS